MRHKWLTTKVSKQRGKDTLAAPLGHLTVSVALQLLTDRLRKHETQSMLLRFESLAYCRCVRVSPSSSSYSEGEAPDRILPTALTGRSRSAPAGSLTLTGVFFLEPNGNRTPLNAAATVDKTPFPLGWTSLGHSDRGCVRVSARVSADAQPKVLSSRQAPYTGAHPRD